MTRDRGVNITASAATPSPIAPPGHARPAFARALLAFALLVAGSSTRIRSAGAPRDLCDEEGTGSPVAARSAALRHLELPERVGDVEGILDPVLANRAAGRDRWESEAFAEAAGRKLATLDALLEGREVSARELDSLIATKFRGRGLLPARETARLRRPGAIAARGDPSSVVAEIDREGFQREIERLVRAVGPVIKAKPKIVRVTPRGPSRWKTRVLVEIDGGEAAGPFRQVRAEWDLEWVREADEWKMLAISPVGHDRVSLDRRAFRDVTRELLGAQPCWRDQLSRGIEEWWTRLDAASGLAIYGHQGIAVGDCDGDGWEDLFVAQPAGLPDLLLRNESGRRLRDVTREAGLDILDATHGPLFVDLDGDGDLDLLAPTPLELLLFENDGKGRFRRRFDPGLRAASARGATILGCAAADHDRDGDLDVFVYSYIFWEGAGTKLDSSYPYPYHAAENGAPNFLLRNEGGFRFVDVTAASGLDAGNQRFSFAASWADFDDDGDPDLYVANDFGRNNLWLNLGGGRFRDVAEERGVVDTGNGMGVTWEDWDCDGDLDLYVADIWSPAGNRIVPQDRFGPRDLRAVYLRMARGNSLFRNGGDGSFADQTPGSDAAFGRWAWSSQFLDVEGDGSEDLYVVNGFITGERIDDLRSFFWRQVVPLATGKPGTRLARYELAWESINRLIRQGGSWSGHERNTFFLNSGSGEFINASAASGLDFADDGRALAVWDPDLDGDPDLVLKNRTGPQLRLLRNESPPGPRRLVLRLLGPRGVAPAVGARARLRVGGRTRVKEVRAGSGYLSQNSGALFFGLGSHSLVERLEVRWPSGRRGVYRDLEAGFVHTIRPGDSEPERLRFREPEDLHASSVAAVRQNPSPGARRMWLLDPPRQEELPLVREIPPLESGGPAARPRAVAIWSPECGLCRRELAGWARAGAASSRDLELRLVSPAEPASLARRAREIREPLALPGRLASTRELLAVGIFIESTARWSRRLALPTTLLIDRRGRLVRLYQGPVSWTELRADARRAAAIARRPELGLPFPGRYRAARPRRNDFSLGIAYLEAGLADLALSAFGRVAEESPNDAESRYNRGVILLRQGRNREAEAAFRAALRLRGDFLDARVNLGLLRARAGDHDEARDHFERVLAARPDHLEALLDLAGLEGEVGRHERALALYRRAARLEPESGVPYEHIGRLLRARGDLDGAADALREATRRDPRAAGAWGKLAVILAESGRLEQGHEACRRALKIAPNAPTAWFNDGLILERLGRQDEARAAYREAVRLAPERSAPRLRLAALLLAQGRAEGAIRELRSILAREPEHPDARRLLDLAREAARSPGARGAARGGSPKRER